MASALPLQQPSARLNHFLVRCDGRGRWTVRDERNLVGGTFVSEDAAILSVVETFGAKLATR